MRDEGTAGPPAKNERDVIRDQIALLSLAEGFFESRILFSLIRLGVFEALGEKERSLPEIAEAVEARPDTLARLLNAGVTLKLLESKGGTRYRIARRWLPVLLRSAGESYLGNWIGFLSYLSSSLTELDEAARRGGPTVDLLGSRRAEDLREFTLAMHNYAALRGKELVYFLDTRESETLLDVGCGPGTYALHLGMHNPALKLYLLDVPEVLEVTREIASGYPLTKEPDFIPLDLTRDEIPGTYDMVLISNTLHMLGEGESKRLLKRLYQSVNPGGSLVVQAQYLNDNRLGGRWPVFLDLVQLCITPAGRNHSVAETRVWLEDAGFTDITFSPLSIFNTNGFLRGYRR